MHFADVTGLSRIVIAKEIVALFSGCVNKRVNMCITANGGVQLFDCGFINGVF